MKQSLFLAAALLLFPLLSVADGRTFTNKAGKMIEAELIGVESGSAVLKLRGDRTAKVPLGSLSEEDQAYVKSWHEENKNKISERDVELTIEKDTERIKDEVPDRNKGGKGGKGDTNKSSKTETTFKCTLENSSTKTVEGITATYIVYKRITSRGDISDTSTSETSDTIEVSTLPARGKAEFTTDPVECVDFTRKSKKGPSQSQRESVVGFVVSLSVEGREFLKKSEPENFLDRLEEEAKRKATREKDRE